MKSQPHTKLTLLAMIVGLALGNCARSLGPREVFTTVNTEPPHASLEVNISGSGVPWNFIGHTPMVARFWRNPRNPSHRLCLIRVSKPGYYPVEKTYPFETIPAEVNIVLRRVEE